MRIRKVVDKTFTTDPNETGSGTRVLGRLNAAVAANIGEPKGSVNEVSSSQRVSIVQRGGKKSRPKRDKR